MRLLLATAALLVLAGCTVTSIDPARMTPAELEARPDYMMIVPSVPKGVKVIGPVKADKVVAFKYRRRKGYHRTVGHRQKLTRVKITSIGA
jgi:hypothetical protein